MRIQNTATLRHRADWHADKGHIMQGTYGDAPINGSVDFHGCAIGCLSAPHTERGLLAFLKRHAKHHEGGGLDIEGEGQRKALADEFGLNYQMIETVEALFEAQLTHGAAIEFVRDFAYAVNDGAEITDEQIRAWLLANDIEGDGWSNMHESLEGDESATKKATNSFLNFLASCEAEEEAREEVLTI